MEEEKTAEVFEKNNDLENAISLYRKASNSYASNGRNVACNRCQLYDAKLTAIRAIRELEGEQRDAALAYAEKLFEQVAVDFLENKLLKFTVKSHLFSAGLCSLARGDFIRTKDNLERYRSTHKSFDKHPEYIMLKELSECNSATDVTNVIKNFYYHPLDEWGSEMTEYISSHVFSNA